ncbi:uncharacterized protein DS421_9g269580 [Arachis hypogaea]|nr:uncharacterized protein DS421_9g269580 [Arachis hypogaea]
MCKPFYFLVFSKMTAFLSCLCSKTKQYHLAMCLSRQVKISTLFCSLTQC